MRKDKTGKKKRGKEFSKKGRACVTTGEVSPTIIQLLSAGSLQATEQGEGA